MKAIQSDFFKSKSSFGPHRSELGGANAKGHDRRTGQRKVQRPFDRRKPISITMKASKATGKLSMASMTNSSKVDLLLQKCVKSAGVKVHRFANVGNHLHLLASFPSRDAFKRFVRMFAGELARVITGARKGKPFGKFWDALAHSRVIAGRKAYAAIDRYIFANQIEVKFGYQARELVRKGMKFSFRSSD